MDMLERILAEVPKDADGFDDLDAFWNVTDKLVFPLSERMISNVFRAAKVQKSTGIPMGDSDSEGDFDYETSSEISMEIFVADEVENDDDASTEPENDDNLRMHMSADGSPSQLDSTIPLTPSRILDSSFASSSAKSRSMSREENLGDVSVASSGLGDMSFRSRVSKVSARGRKSELLSTPSESDISTVKISPDKPSPSEAMTTPSTTPSTVASTGDRSGAASVNNTTIRSVTSKASSKVSDFTIDDTRMVSPHMYLDDEHPSMLFSGRRSSRSASRRVSFGEHVNLSPIEVQAQDDMPGMAEGDEQWPDDEGAAEQEQEDSEEADRTASTTATRSSRKSASSRASTSHNSSLNNASSVSNISSVGGHSSSIDASALPEESEEPSQVSRRMTPTSLRSSASFRSEPPSRLEQTPQEVSRRSSHSTATPRSIAMSTPGSAEFIRGRRLSDTTFHEDSEEASEDDDVAGPSTPVVKGKGKKDQVAAREEEEEEFDGVTEAEVSTSFIDQSFLNTISSANKKYAGKKMLEETKALKKQQQKQQQAKKRRRIGGLDIESDGGEEEEEEEATDDSEAEAGARRSRRATKGRRFAFWKNERPIYQEGTMVGLQAPDPTPKKKRSAGTKRAAPAGGVKKLNKKMKVLVDSDEEDADDADGGAVVQLQEALPPVKLPAKLTYLDPATHPTFAVWDDASERLTRQRVVNERARMAPLRALPVPEGRPAGKNKAGLAGHMFTMPEVEREMSGWIAGYLDLPPQAIKDAEMVGTYAQIFFFSAGQPGALEFAMGDPSVDDWDDRRAQRVVLSPGDSFYVPPGNAYRLENHSEVKTAQIFFVVIEPIAEPLADAGSSVSARTATVSR